MPRTTVEPLPEGCPWSGFTPPNVDWCEEELCSWIVNPAGTWSNLAYIGIGVLMWQRARRWGNPRLSLFGPASVAVGVGSFAYHASYSYLLQFFDFVGMFLFCFTVISANAVRLRWVSPRRQTAFFLTGVAFLSALVPVVSETAFPIQGLVGVLIAGILGQEIAIHRGREADSSPTIYAAFWLALLLLALAGAASLADLTRVWCDPQNHWVQGHAVWHVLTAASLYALFVFYARLAPADADLAAEAGTG